MLLFDLLRVKSIFHNAKIIISNGIMAFNCIGNDQ